jgi:hypothetical protein
MTWHQSFVLVVMFNNKALVAILAGVVILSPILQNFLNQYFMNIRNKPVHLALQGLSSLV